MALGPVPSYHRNWQVFLPRQPAEGWAVITVFRGEGKAKVGSLRPPQLWIRSYRVLGSSRSNRSHTHVSHSWPCRLVPRAPGLGTSMPPEPWVCLDRVGRGLAPSCYQLGVQGLEKGRTCLRSHSCVLGQPNAGSPVPLLPCRVSEAFVLSLWG